MKVEIWSDIMCPFCYIGKRKFETAINQFADKDNIEVVWKSFQLVPDMVTDRTKNINEYLAVHKSVSIDEAKKMNAYVTEMAKKEGLVYNFDKAVVANSFNAHRFLHFAKQYNKQDEAKEKLLSGYFTDGKNIDDNETLIALGAEIGLDTEALKIALDSDRYANEVREDITEAMQLGIRGVPFFVFDRKYGISGAQDVQVFTETIAKSFGEWREANPKPAFEMAAEGDSCEIGKDCD